MGSEFVPCRAAPIYHNDDHGNRIHDPLANEYKVAMQLAQEVVNYDPRSTQPMRKI